LLLKQHDAPAALFIPKSVASARAGRAHVLRRVAGRHLLDWAKKPVVGINRDRDASELSEDAMGENCPVDLPALVEQHYELLYRYAYHLSGSSADAEDLTQETFCTAQAKLHQLRDATHARAWLCAILRNHYLRGRRTNVAVPVQSLDDLPDHATVDPGDAIDAERVRQVLAELPEAYRTTVILYYFEEFSYRQIAQQMGVPVGTVMSRLSRAKAYLRNRLRPRAARPRVQPALKE
jgi:RNA polymerase sigma-70 factor (ECF subfamily)